MKLESELKALDVKYTELLELHELRNPCEWHPKLNSSNTSIEMLCTFYRFQSKPFNYNTRTKFHEALEHYKNFPSPNSTHAVLLLGYIKQSFHHVQMYEDLVDSFKVLLNYLREDAASYPGKIDLVNSVKDLDFRHNALISVEQMEGRSIHNLTTGITSCMNLFLLLVSPAPKIGLILSQVIHNPERFADTVSNTILGYNSFEDYFYEATKLLGFQKLQG